MTVRTVYVISPEKILKLALTYPASTGRNFDEVRAEEMCTCVPVCGWRREREGGVRRVYVLLELPRTSDRQRLEILEAEW